MRKRAHVYYSGRVQGVGFRYSVRAVACGYEVTGYARNLADGRVEVIAEGDEEEAQAFLAAIRDSQLGGYIRGENVNWSAASGEFNQFEIRH
jgi:acylphosphatase